MIPKKAQVIGPALNWVPAFILIFFIMILFVFVSSLIAKTRALSVISLETATSSIGYSIGDFAAQRNQITMLNAPADYVKNKQDAQSCLNNAKANIKTGEGGAATTTIPMPYKGVCPVPPKF